MAKTDRPHTHEELAADGFRLDPLDICPNCHAAAVWWKSDSETGEVESVCEECGETWREQWLS